MQVELIKTDAADLDVARAAWVSTKGEESKVTEDEKIYGLINYLMKHRHGSPFEHNNFTFFIKCPIFVVREFHRHRAGWSYNEWSGRYSEMKPEFYIPGPERKLVQGGSSAHPQLDVGTMQQSLNTGLSVYAAAGLAWEQYQSMLEDGIAREVARIVLPLNIYTSFYATCNARSLMHFLSLRTERHDATFVSHPQREIEMVAEAMEEIFKEVMPLTHKAFDNNGRVSP